MKKNVFCILTVISLFFISSCQKEISSEENNSTQALGKWNINSAVQWWSPTGGSTVKDTFSFAGEGVYRDFRSDGKVYSLLTDGFTLFYDTANFKISGNKIILWNSSYRDTGDIQKLTRNEFSLYKKTLINNSIDKGILEVWNHMTK
ncbi:hypothetical protein OCK74_23390 [Chitinophagaceae bacterium LB-8]|uniref:Lipocalin-like domain-containing protein n=1 Tax=Paraflavisolibacter caeni TaxID=2982496 RepID=A0A9X3BK33_9BACT|nr:hypothetical protein [Paraflavisolibacter caeni]MCU7552083.1 hypothetical protein [Paraflavisolibacter caeni]